MSLKLDREKQEIINKFDNLMKQNKDITPETIKEMFPDDDELYEHVKELKEKEKQMLAEFETEDGYKEEEEKEENNQKKDNDTGIENKVDKKEKKKSTNEKEIEKKVEEFKNKLQQKLDKVIQEEKVKEEKRQKDYENAKTETEKKNIEKRNAAARADSSKKINLMKNDNEKKVEAFKKKLQSMSTF